MKAITHAQNVAHSIINSHNPNTPIADLLAEAFCLGYVRGRQGPTLEDWAEAEERFGIRALRPEDYGFER